MIQITTPSQLKEEILWCDIQIKPILLHGTISFYNILGTCQKLAVGGGGVGGDFQLSIENDVTLPRDRNEIS